MAKLDRVHQKIFASTAAPQDVGIIGSLHEGDPTQATTVQDIQSLPAFEAGLRGVVIGENSPILEEDNAFYKLVTYQLAYLFQNGIPEWSPLVEYQNMVMTFHNGEYYFLETSSTSVNQEPGADATWTPFYLTPDLMPDRYIRRDALKVPSFSNDSVTSASASNVEGEWTDIMSVTRMNKTGCRIYFTAPDSASPGNLLFASNSIASYGDLRVTKTVDGNTYPLSLIQVTSFTADIQKPTITLPGSLNTVDPFPTNAEREGANATFKVQMRLFKNGASNASFIMQNVSMLVVEA